MNVCLKHNGDILSMTANFLSIAWNISEGSTDKMVKGAIACLHELQGVECELSAKLMDLEMADFKEAIVVPQMTFGLAFGDMTLLAGGDESTRLGLLVGGAVVLDSVKALNLCDATGKLVGTGAVADTCGDTESSEIPDTDGFCEISISESMTVQELTEKKVGTVPDSPFLKKFSPQGIEKYDAADSNYAVGDHRSMTILVVSIDKDSDFQQVLSIYNAIVGDEQLPITNIVIQGGKILMEACCVKDMGFNMVIEKALLLKADLEAKVAEGSFNISVSSGKGVNYVVQTPPSRRKFYLGLGTLSSRATELGVRNDRPLICDLETWTLSSTFFEYEANNLILSKDKKS
jgi:hypothetical protein